MLHSALVLSTFALGQAMLRGVLPQGHQVGKADVVVPPNASLNEIHRGVRKAMNRGVRHDSVNIYFSHPSNSQAELASVLSEISALASAGPKDSRASESSLPSVSSSSLLSAEEEGEAGFEGVGGLSALLARSDVVAFLRGESSAPSSPLSELVAFYEATKASGESSSNAALKRALLKVSHELAACINTALVMQGQELNVEESRAANQKRLLRLEVALKLLSNSGSKLERAAKKVGETLDHVPATAPSWEEIRAAALESAPLAELRAKLAIKELWVPANEQGLVMFSEISGLLDQREFPTVVSLHDGFFSHADSLPEDITYEASPQAVLAELINALASSSLTEEALMGGLSELSEALSLGELNAVVAAGRALIGRAEEFDVMVVEMADDVPNVDREQVEVPTGPQTFVLEDSDDEQSEESRDAQRAFVSALQQMISSGAFSAEALIQKVEPYMYFDALTAEDLEGEYFSDEQVEAIVRVVSNEMAGFEIIPQLLKAAQSLAPYLSSPKVAEVVLSTLKNISIILAKVQRQAEEPFVLPDHATPSAETAQVAFPTNLDGSVSELDLWKALLSKAAFSTQPQDIQLAVETFSVTLQGLSDTQGGLWSVEEVAGEDLEEED